MCTYEGLSIWRYLQIKDLSQMNAAFQTRLFSHEDASEKRQDQGLMPSSSRSWHRPQCPPKPIISMAFLVNMPHPYRLFIDLWRGQHNPCESLWIKVSGYETETGRNGVRCIWELLMEWCVATPRHQVYEHITRRALEQSSDPISSKGTTLSLLQLPPPLDTRG